MNDHAIGGSCPDCGEQYGNHLDFCELKPKPLSDRDKDYQNLPPHWQDYILDCKLEQFNNDTHVYFEDGSYAVFKYSFFVHDQERQEVAVFTEHSGYFVFSMSRLKTHFYKELV